MYLYRLYRVYLYRITVDVTENSGVRVGRYFKMGAPNNCNLMLLRNYVVLKSYDVIIQCPLHVPLHVSTTHTTCTTCVYYMCVYYMCVLHVCVLYVSTTCILQYIPWSKLDCACISEGTSSITKHYNPLTNL